jgi:hypothetical protein
MTKSVIINGQEVHCLRFADDIALVAKSAKEMNEMLNTLSNILNEYHLKINAKKTKTMTVRREQHIVKPTIKLRDAVIEDVEEFYYLGSSITYDNKSTNDVKRRIAMAKKTFNSKYNLLTNKHFDLNTRKKFIKSYIWSVLFYGCETWTIGQYEKKWLEATEM